MKALKIKDEQIQYVTNELEEEEMGKRRNMLFFKWVESVAKV